VEGISLPIPNTIRANCTMIVVVAITNSLPRAAVDAPATTYGHHYLSPYRVHSNEMEKRPFGRRLLADRKAIERYFAHATIFGGGLASLPAWVRRQHRVKRWVWAKLLINAVRIKSHQRLTA
jgi:hypothetical protein